MLLLRPRRSIPSDPSPPHTRPIHPSQPRSQLPNHGLYVCIEMACLRVTDGGTFEASIISHLVRAESLGDPSHTLRSAVHILAVPGDAR